MEEEISRFHHHHHNHNRYVPHRPNLSPPDNHRNNYPYLRHHHHLPPPPPPPPPPQLPLPPAPPPPPPYNPHQSQFTFLNHHHPPTQHFTLPHSPPPPPLPRVSNRTLIDHDHHYRPFPNPPPRVSYRPTDSYIRDVDLEEQRSNYRFRDGSVDDGYRDNLQSQHLLWDHSDRHRRGGGDDVDNYDEPIDSYRHDRRGFRYLSNLDRSRGFDSYHGPNSSVSRDLLSGFERDAGRQEPYVPMLDDERFRGNRDEDRGWVRFDSPIETERYDFEFSDEIPSVSTRRPSNVHALGKYNNRGRTEREEFFGTPKKQIQKKSALLRIGKPNHRNKSNDHFSKSLFDDSNTSTFSGKDKDPTVYSDHKMEEEKVGSPVELDVSFKSNSLVAKAIMTPSSPVVVANRNMSPRYRMLRKADTSNSPKTKLARRTVKLDRSTYGSDSPSSLKLDRSAHGSDSPSSSVKGKKQSPEKVKEYGNVSLCDIGSLPCSSGTNDSAGSGAVKGSPVGTVTEQVGNSGGSDGTPSSRLRLRKKKKVSPINLHVSRLQAAKEDGEPVNTDTNRLSEADEAVMPSKDQVASVEIVMVHDDVSLPSPNEPTLDKMDESPPAVTSEKDCAEIDSGRSCLPNTETSSLIHIVDPSAPPEIDSTKKADGSVNVLQFVSNSDEVLNELQNESTTVTDLDKVGDVSQLPCESGVPLLPMNGTVNESSDGIVSRPEEIKFHEIPTDSHDLAHVAFNALTCDSQFIEREEDTTVSGFDSVDAGPKQSSVDCTSAAPETGLLEAFVNVVPSVGGDSIPGLSNAEETKFYGGITNAEETKFHEGTTNADCSNHESSTTSNSNIGPTNFQGNNSVSNDGVVDDTNKQSCLDRSDSLLENGLVDGSPNTKVCSGQDTPTAKKKRKFRDIQMGSSSPSTSDTTMNVVSSIVDGERTLSKSVKDLVSTEEEVSGSGLVNSHTGSQTCNDGGNVFPGNILIEGSSEVELSDRGGVSNRPKSISPKNKKRKVSANHEKPISQEAPKPSVDNSKVNTKSGQAKLDDILVNTTNRAIQSLNSTRGESSLRRNQPNSAVPRVLTGRSSLVFSRKIAPTNHNVKPRTWHRADNPFVSIPPKKSYSVPVPPPKLSPRKIGKIQGASYIRKGHSLVRKPTLSTTLSHGSSHTSSSSVHRLNPSSVGESKKSSGSESREDGTDAASLLKTGGPNSSFERPKTPPLPCSTKSLNCTTTHPADFTFLPLANPPPNGCETTLDSLENRENVDVPKSLEDAPRSSGTLGTDSTNMGSQSVLNEAGKIRYVKRKSNQLVAASNNSDLSVEDVDKTQAKSSDGYYKRRKNQLIRTSADDTSNSEGQWVPKFISSRSSGKKQFGKGSTKMHKHSKFSLVWRLGNTQSLRKDSNSLQRQKVWPNLFPWKRATYWRSFMQNSAPVSNNSSLSTISQKLLLSRKRDTIYTRSTHGFSLRISKLLSVGGSGLKWSKSIERNSKRANEEATLAVAAVEKKKREHIVVAGTKSRNHFSRARIYRIGAVRYKMDPTRRTLQRISDEKKSSLASLQSEKDAKKPYVPRRLVIGNDEYVRLGNGNQLIRDPKKRTRTLASEKVRWSLHTARLRLARKKKYCQFYTRFGKCNKDDGKCPYIHDPSKIAVCTKFLNSSCSNPNCKLTHEVIPERMQDCSYFLQGLCSNENCPYRHVNVNPNASVCEGFLKGYCADGNECRKKHTYVCPVFEATGTCSEGPKCRLHHPKTRTKSVKKKPSMEHKNAQGRYFGLTNIDMSEHRRTAGPENRHYWYSKEDDIFCQEGKFADYVTLDVSDDEAAIGTRIEERTTGNSTSSELQVGGIDELIKPIGIMFKNSATGSSPAVESASASYVSEELELL